MIQKVEWSLEQQIVNKWKAVGWLN